MRQLKTGEHFGYCEKSINLDGLILTHAIQNPSNTVPWHCHENPYFYYHLNGNLTEITKKEHFNCIPGTLIYHQSNEAHCNLINSEHAAFFHVEIEPSWLAKYGLANAIPQGNIELNKSCLNQNFLKLFNESKNQDHYTQLAVDGILLESFSHMLRGHKQPSRYSKPQWVEKLQEKLTFENCSNLSVNALAAELGLHPVYLSRQFPLYFDTHLGEYIRDLKIEKSIELLSTTQLKNAEIADDCGFCDESHFIRLFKYKYHTTPRKFRQQLLKS